MDGILARVLVGAQAKNAVERASAYVALDGFISRVNDLERIATCEGIHQRHFEAWLAEWKVRLPEVKA